MVGTTTVSNRLRSPNFRPWSTGEHWTDAFAFARLCQVSEFHLSLASTNVPVRPFPSSLSTRGYSYLSTVICRYSMLLCFGSTQRWTKQFSQSNWCRVGLNISPVTISLVCEVAHQTTNASTATILVYAIGAGITAAAGTRLALQLILAHFSNVHSFQSLENQVLIFSVTTSPYRDWVICAPAAILRCGSCL